MNWLLLLFIFENISLMSVHLLRRMIKLLLFLSQNVQTFIVQTMTLKSAVFCKKQNGNLNCTFFNLLHTEQ